MIVRIRWNGFESTDRREKIVEGGFYVLLEDGRLLTGKPYEPKGVTYMVKVPSAFEVETSEGLMVGKAGDFLAVGPRGEMFAVKASLAALRYDEKVDVEFLD